VRYEIQFDHGRDQIADGIALLQHARREPACFKRKVLERGGRREAPDAAHRDTEEGPHGEEGVEVLDEARSELEHRAGEQVRNQRPLAPEAIGEDAEEDGAERPEQERERDSGRLEQARAHVSESSRRAVMAMIRHSQSSRRC
jgi:hypothetical protein